MKSSEKIFALVSIITVLLILGAGKAHASEYNIPIMAQHLEAVEIIGAIISAVAAIYISGRYWPTDNR